MEAENHGLADGVWRPHELISNSFSGGNGGGNADEGKRRWAKDEHGQCPRFCVK